MAIGSVVTVAAVLTGTLLANAAAPALPKRSPAQLIADVQRASAPADFSAVISESANLGLPSLPDIGGVSSGALSAANWVTGTHTVEIWAAGPGRLRLAVPVSFGETDLRVNRDQAWLWDSQTQTATHLLPPKSATSTRVPQPAARLPHSTGLPHGTRLPHGTGSRFAAMTPQSVARTLLAAVGPSTRVSVAGTGTVAGRSAYLLTIAPRTDRSLIGRVVIAVDSATYLPLRVQVFARSGSSPALSVGFTSLSFARPAASNFTFSPPAGAHVKTERLSGLPGRTAVSNRAGAARPPRPGSGRGRPVMRKLPKGGLLKGGPLGRLLPSGGQVLGTGWLSVAVISAGAASALSAGGSALPALPAQAHAGVRPAPGPAAILGVLYRSASRVHGSWGSGRLLRTTLFSVLITSRGKVLIGAVTPAVLYADAAKVK
jgi:hypothetical protein